MSEAEWQKQVIEWAQKRDWYVYHHYDSRQSKGKDFPDLVLVRQGTMLCIELKREHDYPTVAQRKWLQALNAVSTLRASVWRPSDWDDVKEMLQ